MGPKVEAACRFVEATGRPAMIGRLGDAAALLAGTTGPSWSRNPSPTRTDEPAGRRRRPPRSGQRPGRPEDASLAEVEARLQSSEDGLTQAEAEQRLARYGPNEIDEKTTNPLLKFLTYFWGPIPWMIEVAVVLSGVLKHWPDFFIILVLLLANAGIGFWEERQAAGPSPP